MKIRPVLLALIALIGATPVQAQPYVLDSRVATSAANDPLRIQIATDGKTYARNQAILVTVSVVNGSDTKQAVYATVPWDAVRLVIFKADGTEIPLPKFRSTEHYRMPLDVPIEPNQSFTYGWWDARGETIQHSFDISKWGYGALPPGRYTVVAWPWALGSYVHGHPVPVSRSSHSNAIDITVLMS
jgi:hypothetical protein